MTIPDQEIVWSDAEVRSSRLGTVLDYRDEKDIERLVELANPSDTDVALDLVTGLGHVSRALAPRVLRVDALDPDGEMLKEAEALTVAEESLNINFIEGNPSSLPFDDGVYDIVAARMALRHLGDSRSFFKEIHRVLKPSGRVLLVDSLASQNSDLEAFLKNLLSHQDRSYVKSHTLTELESTLERQDFDIEMIEIYPKLHDFETWVTKLGADMGSVRMMAKMLTSSSTRIKRHFRVIEKKKQPVSFITWMILIKAKPAEPGES